MRHARTHKLQISGSTVTVAHCYYACGHSIANGSKLIRQLKEKNIKSLTCLWKAM